MEVYKTFEIIKLENNQKTVVQDQIITEYELALYLNGAHFVDLLCTPRDLECLIYGHLFAEGIIRHKSEVQELRIEGNRADVFLKREVCPFAGQNLPTNLFIRAADVYQAVDSFHSQSELMARTGGAHNCELYHSNGERIFMEDLGRHNAGDKALGRALLAGWDLKRVFMITSGRVPKYMAQKAINTGISIIISKSPPTDQAVELARLRNLTLCGFVRGKRMNIYSAPERILDQFEESEESEDDDK